MATDTLAIATRALTKQFDRHVAVCEVDLQIASGEVYGLVGPNGAGKTTLLRLLAGMELPTAGEIHLHGRRFWCDARGNPLRQYLGYLADDFPLYDEMTVVEYLDYFARLYNLRQPKRRRRVQEVLELVQLTTKRHSAIATLSRGMKQRLGLARTLVHEPLLLLLDEPVSGLDPRARLQFRDIIGTLREAGMTVLISSHILSDLAQICTAIGIMELGYLVESAPLSVLHDRLGSRWLYVSAPGALEALTGELRNAPQVGELEVVSQSRAGTGPTSGQLRARFNGSEEDAAALLRALVTANIPVTEFRCTPDDLETIFHALDHQQAS
ncbi:ABC transporter ATP-binding protein [Rubidibacter lacunae]|nr:ABC transporter ATP-binding protein [Rubidibacter lacunae]